MIKKGENKLCQKNQIYQVKSMVVQKLLPLLKVKKALEPGCVNAIAAIRKLF